MIDLKLAKLHDGIFLAGSNLKDSLEPAKRDGLKIQLDENEDRVVVFYKGEQAFIKTYSYVVPLNSKESPYEIPPDRIKVSPQQQSASPNKKIQAQVSTPQSHVFADGSGVTGQGGRVK